MSKLSVVVGRFQVPQLHDGHYKVLSRAAEDGDKVLVLIGYVPGRPPTSKNPLTLEQREEMIQDWARQVDVPVMVLPLADSLSNIEWSERLDKLIDVVRSRLQEVQFVVGRDSFESHYTGEHSRFISVSPAYSGDVYNRNIISGTNIRKSCVPSREGIIGATLQREPMAYMAVDAVCCRVHEGKHQLLVGRKPWDRTKWRFPGGFLDVKDDSLEMAARRELKEETGVDFHTEAAYLGSFRTHDWRYQGEKDELFTCAYAFGYMSGAAEAGDDLAEVAWMDAKDLLGGMKEEPLHGGWANNSLMAGTHSRILYRYCQKFAPELLQTEETDED